MQAFLLLITNVTISHLTILLSSDQQIYFPFKPRYLLSSTQLVPSRSGIFVRQACSPNTNRHSFLTFECEFRSRHEPFLSVFHCVRDRHLLRRFWWGKSFNFFLCWIVHWLAEITARTKTLINFLRGRRKTHSDPNSAWLHSWEIHVVFARARRLIVEIRSHLSHSVGWSTLAAVRVFSNFLIRARYVKPFFFRRNFSTRASWTTQSEGFVSDIRTWTRGAFFNRRSFIGRDFCSRASLTKGFVRAIIIRTRINKWSTRPIHVHCIWFV